MSNPIKIKTQKPFYKRWLVVIPVIIVIASLFFVVPFLTGANNRNNQNLDTYTVTKNTIQKTVSDSSRLEPVDLRKIWASSGSKIVEVKVKTNSSVTAGQVLATVEFNGRNTDLTSPITGTVTQINYLAGEVQQNQTEFMQIADLSNFKINVSVNENDINSVRENQNAKVRIKPISLDKEFDGSVSLVPQVSEKSTSGNYNVTVVTTSKPQDARAGMKANVTITADKKDSVLAVPTERIFQKGDGNYVKLIDWINKDQGIFSLRDIKVETGLSSDTMTEITKGINEGENIALPNQANARLPIPFSRNN
jgi:HlyD family secretion protein